MSLIKKKCSHIFKFIYNLTNFSFSKCVIIISSIMTFIVSLWVFLNSFYTLWSESAKQHNHMLRVKVSKNTHKNNYYICHFLHQEVIKLSTGTLKGIYNSILCKHLWLSKIFLWFLFFKEFIYLFLERRGGREKERERSINVWLPLMLPPLRTWPTTQACALTGNQTGNTLVHRPALNPLSHTSQGWFLNVSQKE